MMTKQPYFRTQTTRGFARVSGLVQKRVSKASEGRGFAVSRLLTHWADVVGLDVARVAVPVDVSYGRGSFGATLTLLTTGAQAPMLEMQKEKIREQVNGCYGYNAIARLKITQTSPQGFRQGRVAFEREKRVEKAPDNAAKAMSEGLSRDVGDQELQRALQELGAQVFAKNKQH